jgi:quinol monooxygenase YgiN
VESEEARVVIVAGTFEVEPEQRDAFLTGKFDRMRASRVERGCLEYTFSADPLDPGRVLLFERWASQEDLDAHLAVPPAPPVSPETEVVPKSVSILVYDVTGERPLGG